MTWPNWPEERADSGLYDDEEECMHEGVECERNTDSQGNPECPCPCDECRIEEIPFT